MKQGASRHALKVRGDDLDRLRSTLRYDPASGLFFWRVDRANKKAGEPAGNIGPNGYCTICVDYVAHYAHRLAIAFSDGELPLRGAHVDHINGVKNDNRRENLRVTSPSKNG